MTKEALELQRVTVYERPEYDYTDAELRDGLEDNEEDEDNEENNQEEMEEGEL